MDDFLIGPQCDEMFNPYEQDPIEDSYLDSYWENLYDLVE